MTSGTAVSEMTIMELWVECLQRTLEECSESSFTSVQLPDEAPAAGDTQAFPMYFGGDSSAVLTLYCEDAARLQVLQLLAGEPLHAGGAMTPESEQKWQDAMARLGLDWCGALRGVGVTLSPRSPGPADAEGGQGAIRSRWQMQSGASLFTFCLEFTGVAADGPARVELHAPAQIETPSLHRAPVHFSTEEDSTTAEANHRLLLDVELFATLRFGTREMPLREVLELCPGDVIALDRAVHAPVDLIVGDRIVATGVVVVADGNYGLRVQEIAQPKERLEGIRCLF